MCAYRQAKLLLQIEQVKAWSLVKVAEEEITECQDQLDSVPEVCVCVCVHSSVCVI